MDWRVFVRNVACVLIGGAAWQTVRQLRLVCIASQIDRAAGARKNRFRLQRGSQYGYQVSNAGHIDTWRVKELVGLISPLPRFGFTRQRHIVYLDYAGAGIPTASQLKLAEHELGAAVVLANPHSTGPAAAAAADAVARACRLVLEHFCGDAAHEWTLIWTSGATASLR